jgi:hypothetical protein
MRGEIRDTGYLNREQVRRFSAFASFASFVFTTIPIRIS